MRWDVFCGVSVGRGCGSVAILHNIVIGHKPVEVGFFERLYYNTYYVT